MPPRDAAEQAAVPVDRLVELRRRDLSFALRFDVAFAASHPLSAADRVGRLLDLVQVAFDEEEREQLAEAVSARWIAA